MLIYGDVERVRQPVEMRQRIAETLSAVLRMDAGRARHELLVMAFIEVGELLQGLADQDFHRYGADDPCERQQSGAALLLALAQAIIRSWEDGFSAALSLRGDWPELLDRLDSPKPVQTKRPEGYAYYALYPESYAEAARRSGLSSRTVVIGLRSIGIGLAAIVAAALGAGPAFSLRPVGHPFRRRAEVGAGLAGLILADPDCDFAIVDEGPGLSGSSFGSVEDWLRSNGVSPDRIHMFPSHGGDLGPQASETHRQHWKERPRHVVNMDDLILDAARPEHRLQNWAGDLVGIRHSSWKELSGGAWREIRYGSDGEWPPSHRQMEKRKFLMRADGSSWLVKYAGLSHETREKVNRGKRLSEAGFCPHIDGLCYGFLVEAWVEGRSMDMASADGADIIDQLGRYLGFRARHLPAPGGGASLEDLFRMAVVNIEEACGSDTAEELRKRLGDPHRLMHRLRRVDTDNRLHRWEWVMAGDGRLVKTDAIDHNGAHDLIGCQDIAWDVAGACVEFDLTDMERNDLAIGVAQQAGSDLRSDILRVFEACYLGFQIGLWSDAAIDSEQVRVEKAMLRYGDRLTRLIREGWD